MITLPRPVIWLFMLCVRVVVQAYTVVTLPLYYLFQNPKERLRLAQAVRSRQLNPLDPYSPWVRTGSVPDHILTSCRTVYDCYEVMKQLYPPNRPVIGYRTIIEDKVVLDALGQEVRIDGKTLRKFRLTDYQWMTYQDVLDTSTALARGLLVNGVNHKDKLVVFNETCAQNLLFTIATQLIGIISIGVFNNLGDDGIVFAINETQAQHIFTSYDLLPKVFGLLPRCPTLTTIIFLKSKYLLVANNNDYSKCLPPNVKLISYSKILSDGHKAPDDMPLQAFQPDEVAIIGYTSGTTGQPKGLFATPAQIREAALAVLPAVEKFMSCPERHIYVAYLPQAHILEACIELIAFIGGARIGFANPFTLNESAPGLAAGETCDLKLLKPTLMASVPLVLERMLKEIYLKLSKRTPFSTDIFNYLINYKIHWTQKGYDCPIVRFLLCSRVKEQFGGKLEQLMVGSAPLSPKLQAIIQAALDVKLVQGYGATELAGAVMSMDDYDLSYGRSGQPLAGIQVRLEDWEEGGYRATDKPNPRGELIIGGKGITKGYLNNDELTAQSYIDDGNGLRWFRTGDIGEAHPDGTFAIIDRKKDLIKLSNGEFFSLGKIESCLKNCTYVDNICIIGRDSSLIGLVVPNIINLQKLAKSLKLSELVMSLEMMCQTEEVIETIHKAIIEYGLENKLSRREIPEKVYICGEEWTPDNGLLTAAMKLKRPAILSKYRTAINNMFGSDKNF